MLRKKTFVKRTRKGNVIKVVNEHYLRDDISCSSQLCTKCPHFKDPVLSTLPRSTSTLPNHYLVPDTNVFMNQLDLLEHNAIKDVVILETVRDELRHLSMPVFNRLSTLLSDTTKRFYLFANEHHKDTYIEKLHGESPNDRNDRAIRVSAKWYKDHFKDHGLQIVMLTDDRANREKGAAIGLKAVSVTDYVKGFVDVPELADIVSHAKDANAKKEDIMYEQHLSPTQIQHGIKKGTLFQASLQVSTHNIHEATVSGEVDGEARTIYVLGRKHMNRSIQGDIVALQLLPASEWKRSASMAMEDSDDEEAGVGDGTDMTSVQDGPGEPTAKVVGIVRKKWRPYCGALARKSVHSKPGSTAKETVIFRTMDRRVPPIKIQTTQAHALIGQRIVVAIDSWPVDSMLPLGHFVKVLGSSGDRETETEVLLLEHDVPYQEFSKRVLADLPSEGDDWVVTDQHVHHEKRLDLRDRNICSIDPPGCTDIDDALHVKELDNGHFEVGVHIADVTYFVKPGQAMDEEAAGRGTSVYLVDKRIDMLPSLLGTNLCSLRSNVDRLAFSCIWEMTEEGEIVDVKYTKSIIQSKYSFTYEEAQTRIDDERMQDDLTRGIRRLNKYAKRFRAARMARGALTLASPEVRFQLENDSQDPVDVEMKELKETNALVEEFMLLANIAVAEKIYKHFRNSAMLRRHPSPPASNFDQLRDVLHEYNLDLDLQSSKSLADSLNLACVDGDSYFNTLVRIMTTRCMMQAQYFCSGTESEPEFRHYGLATPIYTHFTSPIRRYSDVIVHRLLQAAIDPDAVYGKELTDMAKMKDQCDVLNHRHRMAQMAGRSSVELYTNLFFRGKTEVEMGRVIRVLKNGFVVLVPKFGIEGIVYTNAHDSPFHLEETSNQLVANDVTIKIFGHVKVQITVEGDQDGMRQKMKMQLVEPVVPGVSVQPTLKRALPESTIEETKKAKV
ncbi:RNB-domain-containing protein [Hesseltinella vesiculosa]|uniref:Ribosomal RNA-processing protein 44 n=1 Tax=Hesseltinella vesiculosa TaxID=101127 RepID=A0A1X2G7N3_9FUNG|nr:RNB-domain-containing protein [Hesseltinella vesiculosa]